MPTAIEALQHVHIIDGKASAVARSGPFEPEKSRVKMPELSQFPDRPDDI